MYKREMLKIPRQFRKAAEQKEIAEIVATLPFFKNKKLKPWEF